MEGWIPSRSFRPMETTTILALDPSTDRTGVAVAIMMALFGLVQLRLTSDEGATEKARVLAEGL